MQVKGDILQIKNVRSSQLSNIEVHVDQITYITHKKDGRFYQPFEHVVVLNEPLILTGDLLSRAPNSDFEEEDYNFYIFDKEDDTYKLNENKRLTLTLVYVEEADQTILNSGTYSVVVSNDEYNNIKKKPVKSSKVKLPGKRK